MAKEICKTLIPFARKRKIFSSSSVKPQSRSNCSRSSRGNCSLFFVPGVVKLRRMLSVVIGYTLHIRVKKCLCEAFRRLYAIDAAECFYGFFHVFSVMSVYKDFGIAVPSIVFVELLEHLVYAGRGKAGDDTNSNRREVVRGREVRHDVQRKHAERCADDTADRRDPLVINGVGVLDDDAYEVGNHDDRHAGSQAEDVFHFLILLRLFVFENTDAVFVIGHAVVQLLIFFLAVVDTFVELFVLLLVVSLHFVMRVFQPVHSICQLDDVGVELHNRLDDCNRQSYQRHDHADHSPFVHGHTPRIRFTSPCTRS
nr:MAG TPA: hypothetical protein [Caudoviricetes sp.]